MTTIAINTKQIRELRERRGFSQEDLAEQAHVRQPTISDLENGKSRRIGFAVLDRLCAVLRCGVEDLLQRKKAKGRAGRNSKPEREIRALQVEYDLDGEPAAQHLRAAVEALERGDGWAAVLHAHDAGAGERINYLDARLKEMLRGIDPALSVSQQARVARERADAEPVLPKLPGERQLRRLITALRNRDNRQAVTTR